MLVLLRLNRKRSIKVVAVPSRHTSVLEAALAMDGLHIQMGLICLFGNKMSCLELLCPHHSLCSESPALNFQPQLFVVVFYTHFSRRKKTFKKQQGIQNVNAIELSDNLKKS